MTRIDFGSPATAHAPRRPSWRIAGRQRPSPWLFVAAALAQLASPSFAADPGRGRLLYENHCQQCHTANIHSRAKKLPLDRNELRVIVDDWRRQINLPWTPDETEDVVEYLNRTRYRFAPD